MLKFKKFTDKVALEEEWEMLDKRLQAICLALAGFVSHRFSKDLVITSIYRGDNKLSTHKYWRAFDFRIHQSGAKDPHFTKEEQEQIKNFMRLFRYSDDLSRRKYSTLKIHGKTRHGHVQVSPSSYTRIFK